MKMNLWDADTWKEELDNHEEFYHPRSHNSEVPRIFGMTASPVKAKGSSEATEYRKKIQKLENLMDSKVYTCDNQFVLEGCISFPAVKFKFCEQNDPPLSKDLSTKLSELVMKHAGSLKKKSIRLSVHKKLQSLAMAYSYCVRDLGLWVALKRLEFLGDSVLDHLVTLHLYSTHPRLSPGLLTEMRSASVNNNCYAYATTRAKLHEHILHDSNDLHKDFDNTMRSCQQLLPESIFGWQFDIHFPKVLADVIGSLAGAIFVDSGYDKNVVFKSLRPLLEPLVTPETLKIHPVQKLQHYCQKHKFVIRKPVVCRDEEGVTCYKLEVEANGALHTATHVTADRKLAQRITSKAILKTLKDSYGC